MTSNNESTPSSLAAAKSTTSPKPAAVSQAADAPQKKYGGGVLVGILILSLAGVSGFLFYEQMKIKASLVQSTDMQKAHADRLQSSVEGVDQQLEGLKKLTAQKQQQQQETLKILQQRIDGHSDRIRSMSTTSRDDWLLAEAQYLLSLASQRLVIEREASTATALLESADRILKGFNDIELMSVRKAIKKERMDLELANAIDRQGIYLELAALADQLDKLSVFKIPEINFEKLDESPAPVSQGFVENLKMSAVRTFDHVLGLIRFSGDYAQPVTPILPPDQRQYLKQNIRFMMEQAQLALLNEQQAVYKKALQKTQVWVETHYVLNGKEASVLVGSLENLAALNVQQTIPDISQSRRMLEDYIETLHKLKPITQSDQASTQPTDKGA